MVPFTNFAAEAASAANSAVTAKGIMLAVVLASAALALGLVGSNYM